jgi:hypothetical protein
LRKYVCFRRNCAFPASCGLTCFKISLHSSCSEILITFFQPKMCSHVFSSEKYSGSLEGHCLPSARR